MDGNSERKCAMALRLLLMITAACLSVLPAFADYITNVNDIVGIPLTSNVLARIGARNRTTPDRCFLGCIRAFCLGNASDLKFYFTDDLWRDATGLEPDAPISGTQSQNFKDAICDGYMSNQIFSACSIVVTNGMRVVESIMTDVVGSRTSTNNFRHILVFTNSAWMVKELFLDGQSIRSDDEF